MVSFGVQEAAGLLALVILFSGAALAARAALSTRTDSRDARRTLAKLDDFEEREEIGRLRHRDFDAFMARLNSRRARLGQEPLAKAFLEPHRYNLMYSVDAGDVDQAALDKLKKRVGKAVKGGEDPVAAATVGEPE